MIRTITLCCVLAFDYEGWGGLMPSGMTTIYVNPNWIPRCEQMVGWIKDDCLRNGAGALQDGRTAPARLRIAPRPH